MRRAGPVVLAVLLSLAVAACRRRAHDAPPPAGPAPAPTLTGVAPTVGSTAGATTITLTGTGFDTGTQVRLGGQLAAVTGLAIDGTSLTFTTPAGLAGAASLQLLTPAGSELFRAGAFVYTEALQLLAVSPAVGPTSGGTKVTLTGRGFATTGPVAVTFGSAHALAVRVVGSRRIELTSRAAGWR